MYIVVEKRGCYSGTAGISAQGASAHPTYTHSTVVSCTLVRTLTPCLLWLQLLLLLLLECCKV
jgi:hypothetical protein